jgi:hypothetical protein
MTRSTALNAVLYRRLSSRFGEIKIRNEGQQRVVRERRGLQDQLKTHVQQWGEQYSTRCPFCRVGELAVSYMYDQPDGSGRPMLHLAKCFGKDCLGNARNRGVLAEKLNARDGILEIARILPGKVLSEEERIPKLPNPLTRIDKLKKGHPARRYLKLQGFYPDKLGRFFDLSYCENSKDPLTRDRIIIPVSMRDKSQGWQALSISSIARQKYLSAPGMKTSELVYNMDKAREYETPVLVLEPIDVWAFGLMAMIPLGDTLSDRQLSLLKSVLRKKDAVLLFRKKERDHPTVRRLRNHLEWGRDGRLLPVEYREDIPQGRAGRAAMRKLIAEEATKRGMEINYARND